MISLARLQLSSVCIKDDDDDDDDDVVEEELSCEEIIQLSLHKQTSSWGLLCMERTCDNYEVVNNHREEQRR